MAAFRHLARVSVLFVTFSALSLFAQQQPAAPAQSSPCAMPVFAKVVGDPNFFSEQQEEWLGEFMDQSVRQDFHIMEDPDGYLQKLGERLLAQLPPTAVHYHFVIIDSPELNSFGLAGGRIYIHRRMIAFTHNEGELASLVGHEIGHAATHQVAIEMTRWLRELGVTEIGDRQDVLKKWDLFRDNAAKIKDKNWEKRSQDEQLIADRVGLYAMTRAGYDPTQFIEFADRSLQTKGKTGGFWSDFFGRTSAESRRLREIVHNAAPLPATCIAPLQANAEHFAKWQQDVLGSKRASMQEELPGLINKVTLKNPLRGDVSNVEFSPDGKYLLAQDASSVFVLTREPLANVFRLDALDANHAQFTPDSRSIVFYDKELRVEKWDIDTRQRASVHALTVPDCFQSGLSPSGDYMACMEFTSEGEFNLEVIEVATNKTILSRKNAYRVSYGEALMFYIWLATDAAPPPLFEIRFSPDGRYLLVGHRTFALAYDLKSGSEAHVSSHVKDLMQETFAFVSNEELAGMTGFGSSAKLVRVRFPTGEKVDEFKLPLYGNLYSTTQSKYLLMHNKGEYPTAIIDLDAKKATQGFRTSGFNVYDKFFAGELVNGEIALFTASDGKRAATVPLPESPLPSARASIFSPDGKWLAVSGESRGSLWGLETGERVFFTFPFEGAYFDQNQVVIKAAKNEKNPSRMFELDPASKGVKKLFEFDGKEMLSSQQGNVLISLRPEKENSKETFFGRTNSVLEVHDPHTNALLWSKKVGKTLPRFFCTQDVLTFVVDDNDSIKAAAREDSGLSNRLKTISGKDAYLIQAFEATTGNPLGNVLVDTGKLSFKVKAAHTIGDTVFVSDSNHRTLVYSLKSGEQRGKVQGRTWAASPKGDRMLVDSDRGVAELYDTASLQLLSRFVFPARISDADFALGGSELMVLTADQTVYQLRAVPAQPKNGQVVVDSAKTDSSK